MGRRVSHGSPAKIPQAISSRGMACVALVLAGAALVGRRACVPVPACLPAAPRPAADGHPLGQPPIRLPLRPGRE
jgi:hypothetical protein